MHLDSIYRKALDLEPFTLDEGLAVYRHAPLDELLPLAHLLRQRHVPGDAVTWQIDRNINIGNLCESACSFCSFHAGAGQLAPFTTSREEYLQKIGELIERGGDQILLQGGMSRSWPLARYEELFRFLRGEFLTLRIHALGPPEVVYIARQAGLSVEQTLGRLVDAGLSSLPGAGAEILSDRVRKLLSPRKCTVREWLDVMRTAHRMDLLTSATMMYGHLETVEERLQHLIYLRALQDERPAGHTGFIAFIPWPVMLGNSRLARQHRLRPVAMQEHLRLMAVSRLMLHNIPHLQASWLTVGVEAAQLSLWGGADDMGSIMMEENVVAAAGSRHRMDAEGMQRAIVEAGFAPRLRDAAYRPRGTEGRL